MSTRAAASRRSHLLFVAAFVMDLAGGTAIVAVPLLGISLGASESQLGAIGACQRAPYILLCFLSGWIADRVSRKRLAAGACGGLISVYFLFTYATTLWHIFTFVLIGSVFRSFFWPPVQAWVSELPTSTLGNRASFFNMAWSSGATLGCLLGGWLAQKHDLLPFYVCFSLSGLLLILICATPSPTKIASPKDTSSPLVPIHQQHPLTETFLYASWLGNFAAFAAMGIFFYIFPKLAHSLDISKSLIGALLFLSGCSRTITFFSMGRSEAWWYKIRLQLLAGLAGALGIATIAFCTRWQYMIPAFVLVGFMCGISYGTSLFYCLRSAGSVGRRAGQHEAILVAGAMVGSLLGGLSAEHVHPRSPYFLAASLIIVAGATQAWMVRAGQTRLARTQA